MLPNDASELSLHSGCCRFFLGWLFALGSGRGVPVITRARVRGLDYSIDVPRSAATKGFAEAVAEFREFFRAQGLALGFRRLYSSSRL